MIIAVQMLHGICYAFFFATVYIFVDANCPKDIRASAQGLFNLQILGIGALLANSICPWLLQSVYTTGGVTDFRASSWCRSPPPPSRRSCWRCSSGRRPGRAGDDVAQREQRTDDIRVLVVGCGHMGSSHARAYRRLSEDFEIVGLVSRGAASRRRLNSELGGRYPEFSDYMDALAVTRPDAVCISTYAETHADYAVAALEAGAHVFH